MLLLWFSGFHKFPSKKKTSQFISHFVPFLASSISHWFRSGWGNFGRSITVSSWITLCSDSLGWGTEIVNGLYNNSAFHITVYPFALLRHWVNLYASAALPALQCLRSFSLRHSFAQASGLVWACLVCSIFKLVNGGLLCQSCWLHGPLYSTQGIVTRKTAAYWIFEFLNLLMNFWCLYVFVRCLEYVGIWRSHLCYFTASGWSTDVGAVAFEPKAAATTAWKDYGGPYHAWPFVSSSKQQEI